MTENRTKDGGENWEKLRLKIGLKVGLKKKRLHREPKIWCEAKNGTENHSKNRAPVERG